MADISEDAIRAVVVETLCEQQKLHHSDIDAVVDRAITEAVDVALARQRQVGIDIVNDGDATNRSRLSPA